jgi:plastocyanin
MLRTLVAITAVAATGLLVATTSLGGSSAQQTLNGGVGPGFTIKLTKAGKVVKSLKAGTYKLVVADRSSEHNFVLERQGGRERVITSVPFVGTKTVTVKLKTGKYKFYCPPHESSMFGKFTVK